MKKVTKTTSFMCSDGKLFGTEFEANKYQSELDLRDLIDTDVIADSRVGAYDKTDLILQFLDAYQIEVFDYIIYRNAELRNAMKRNK